MDLEDRNAISVFTFNNIDVQFFKEKQCPV